ncbi:MAG: cysteine desulfurase [Ruminococcaceae bacterium]|nr:cysteine desulfurase [Oscillospiraceae bacterium]
MEIGGYFGLENDPTREEYHTSAYRFGLARTALEFLLTERNINKIYVPFYSCYTVFDACKRAGVQVVCYALDDKMHPDLNEVMQDGKYVYITNYFGQLSNDDIAQLKQRCRSIIVDNVQSFFQKPVDGVDTIYSCRKFFGVPDGAYLYTDCPCSAAYEALPRDSSYDRYSHIVGRTDKSASDFYSASQSNEVTLDTAPAARMSRSTQLMLSNINYDYAMQRRKANFAILSDALKCRNKLDVKHNGGLFFYPLYTDNGAQLRRKLIENKVFTPTLWPELLESENAQAAELTRNIVYLPIDQRYGENEMRFILDVVDSL